MQFVGPKKLAPLFCLTHTLKFLACLAYHSRGRAKACGLEMVGSAPAEDQVREF